MSQINTNQQRAIRPRRRSSEFSRSASPQTGTAASNPVDTYSPSKQFALQAVADQAQLRRSMLQMQAENNSKKSKPTTPSFSSALKAAIDNLLGN